MEKDRLLKIKEVCELLNVSTRKFYENIKINESFPKSFSFENTKTKLYSQKEVIEWVNSQKNKYRNI
ncbi:helix-turn-helix transcriptional regulator [Halarcobacter sp.]|uniref:helix-turn-helix transcriptional regulator n=1 Tax=Halarcobacter sp. TaxID=2321133 RepID=UPI000CC76BBD|nr:MAG: hypothetical protein C0625_00250 [Arcobacter sp.]